MQPIPPTGTNAPAQGAAGGGPPQPQPPEQLNITGVRNAAGVNPALLGNWEMDTSAQQKNLVTIGLRLQTRTPPLQVTPENIDTLNFVAQTYQPDLRPLPLGAEAACADITVTNLRIAEEKQEYHLTGFGKDNRLAIGPMSKADRQKLEEESTIATYNYVLNAVTALTDTDVTVTTLPTEHVLEAEYGGKKVVFRRPIAAEGPLDPPLSTPQQETGAIGAVAGALHSDDEIKQQLLGIIQQSAYAFDPNDHTGNCNKLKANWTLCYYQGTTPVPEDNKTKLKITDQIPGLPASPLYANFWQSGREGEGGDLALVQSKLTLTEDDVMGCSAAELEPLPGDAQALPQMFSEGVTVMHLDNEKWVVITEAGEILGFGKLAAQEQLPQ